MQVQPSPDQLSVSLQALIRTQGFFTGFVLAFGLLHLILFLYLRGVKANLYYALFLFLFAGNIYFDYLNLMATDPEAVNTYLRIHRVMVTGVILVFLRFSYALFQQIPGRWYWILSAGTVVSGLVVVQQPERLLPLLYVFYFMAANEWIRLNIRAIKARQEGARVLLAGFGVYIFFSLYDPLVDLRVLAPLWGLENAYEFGLIGLLTAMSVYLAQDMARSQKRAHDEAVARLSIEADNQRITAELNLARDLQESMLPRMLPEVPGLRVATFSRPATEVGGDYYDYQVDQDGTLTVAIGDATGHGLKAGIMVAIVKGLFHSARFDGDPGWFFNYCTATLRKMNLGNLFMSLTIARIRNGAVRLSAAGMPPVLIYRASEKRVDEIRLKGMPLGAFDGFPYSHEDLTLEPGDVMLMMSDGLPEMFNAGREEFGMPAIVEHFGRAAPDGAHKVVEQLRTAADQWRGDSPQADDLSLVAIEYPGQR